MSRTTVLATLLLSLVLPVAAGAQTTAFAAGCSAYAEVPLPAEAGQVSAPRQPPACASYRSYAGIGRPRDSVAARACAWQERLAQKADLGQNEKEPTAWVVGGSLILSDIYFHGAGVPRNVPLAMRLACEWDQRSAELALETLRKDSGTAHNFELCEYGANTLVMNFCTAYRQQVAEESLKRDYARLRAAMTPVQQTAFDTLLQREDAYLTAHAHEVDQGGTIRAMRTMGSQSILRDGFHTHVTRFERGQWPAVTTAQISTADARLNSVWHQTVTRLSKQSKDEMDDGAVTVEGLREAERAWILYRDAWHAFARLRYPGHEDAIQAAIVFERIRLLKTIA